MWYEINLPSFLLATGVSVFAIVAIVAFLIDFFTGEDE